MKRWNSCYVYYILSVMFFFMVSCEKDDTELIKTKTLMVYLDGGSNLVTAMERNIADMAKVWKEEYKANIVIYFESKGSTPKLLTFDIGQKGVVKQRELRTYETSNLTPSEKLGNVLKEMQELYPASSYGLILGSHGSGWMPISMSPRASQRAMKMTDGIPLTRSFGATSEMDVRDMAKALPMGLDFILFDVCLMSSVEVLYELRDHAEYLIVSPAEVPGGGFPYQKVMPYFWGKGKELEDNLRKVCSNFYEYYNTMNASDRFGTIALINTGELDNLYTLTCQILSGQRDKAARISTNAVYCYPRAAYDYNYIFFDLGDYIKYMTGSGSELDKAFTAQMEKVVLYKAATNPFFNTTIPAGKFSGIATYIPCSVWPQLNTKYFEFSWTGVYN